MAARPKLKPKVNKDANKTLDEVEEHKKSAAELQALEDILAERNYKLKKQMKDGVMSQEKLAMLQNKMQQQKSDHQAVSADMCRQYKNMETAMTMRIDHLESVISWYEPRNSEMKLTLEKKKESSEKLIAAKQMENDELQRRNNSLKSAYLKVFHNALDSLVAKIEESKDRWKKKEQVILAENKGNIHNSGNKGD